MSETIYINFHSGINESVVNKLMAAIAEIVGQTKPGCLYFLFSSGGGNVDSGIVLYNFLRALPCKVVMHNTGAIDSIATVIFHAADERYATPHSSFLFHGITWTFGANQTVFKSQLEEIRSGLIECENKIARIISERCKLKEEEIRALFVQGETKNTAFALEKSIIQNICEPKIPANAKFFSFTPA
ncbi:MAG TPA: ATP-dependent Clp protease proteolytic subunit [Verrucomicrobiae bacterium]|nr:ATP-dependent Clp protease proteolytic subunit [Verrucomicrobiae bacterium]